MVICKCGHLHFSTIGRTIPVYYVGLFCQNLLMVSVCHNSCLAVVMSFWKRHKEPDAGFLCLVSVGNMRVVALCWSLIEAHFHGSTFYILHPVLYVCIYIYILHPVWQVKEQGLQGSFGHACPLRTPLSNAPARCLEGFSSKPSQRAQP